MIGRPKATRPRKGLLFFWGAVLAAAMVVTSFAGGAPQAASAQSSSKPAAKSPAKSSATSGTKPSTPKRRRARRPSQRGQAKPTPERIKEIQTALANRGFYTVGPSGKWDSATVEAMKRFQEANGLNPTGKLDAKSLQKLGLGSETAGAAPPRPSANSNTAAKSPPP